MALFVFIKNLQLNIFKNSIHLYTHRPRKLRPLQIARSNFGFILGVPQSLLILMDTALQVVFNVCFPRSTAICEVWVYIKYVWLIMFICGFFLKFARVLFVYNDACSNLIFRCHTKHTDVYEIFFASLCERVLFPFTFCFLFKGVSSKFNSKFDKNASLTHLIQ